ncbi:MmgE/PrpD family protein [Magnetovibrio sp. PR-2]|uniref:MmgE/PrpD family protein n=1 Tax=Magnetovibrio sp. PR-2 TaxID=3120356 RepID=UPI002FCDEC27
MSLTQSLIHLIRSKPVTQDDLDAAALFTLDAVANAVGGCSTEPGHKLLDWAGESGADAGRRALLLGGLTHILEVDDLHRASVVHPGCVVVPAAFALSKGNAQDFLTAVLHGFEATCRVGMAVGKAHYKVWHSTATCGPFGSAMAGAHLLGLSDEQAVHALGNAGTQSAGLWQFMATGAMSKHLHAGRGAEAGVVAAELAKLGFTGPPEILEGAQGLFAGACPDPDPDAVLRNPDHRWQLHESSIKPWPSCRHTHPAIDTALELSAHIKNVEEIERVNVQVYEAAMDVCNRPTPVSVYEAKFSLYQTVAAALADGRVDFDSFEADSRERLAALRAKITPQACEPFVSAYPQDWGSAVEVVLKDGSTYKAERQHCKGDPEAALSKDEMKAKARMLMDLGGYENPDQLMEAILGMAEGGAVPDVFVGLKAVEGDTSAG